MKKLLVAVLACALFAPAFAVEITGDIQTIGLAYENKGVNLGSTNVKQRGTTNRVLLGIGVDLVEDVYAKVTLGHRSMFGENETRGKTLSALEGEVRLAEAYVNISNVFDALEVKVGRQFYGDEKSPVMYFGPDYGYAIGNAYASVDGLTVAYNGEKLSVTAAYLYLWEVNLFNPAPRDTTLIGLDLGYKFTKELSASAYAYQLRKFGDFGFWGIKPTFENDNVKLGAEFARNFGDIEKGWLVKADLALPVAIDDTTLTPRVTYLKSEKGFEAFGNYRPGLMFGTIFGALDSRLAPFNRDYGSPLRTVDDDWEIFNAGLCLKFANLEKWGFGLDFYTGELNGAFNGNSWEAKVVYNHNEYVAFNLAGAVLTNVKHFTASPTAVQLGMNIKF